MQLVYVAHPYINDPEGNMKKIKKVMRWLRKQFPQICFISPLHNFSYAQDDDEEEEILSSCLELLSRCDYLYMFGDYENSTGCKKEIELAQKLLIPVKYWK